MRPTRIVGGYLVERDPFEMGTIASFRGVDPNTLERVIVEEPHPYIEGNIYFMDLFQQAAAEFSALGPVAPRVLRMFGRGSVVHAIVREHVEGLSLDRMLVQLRAQGEQLPIAVACAIVRELVELLRRPVRVQFGMSDVVITPEGHVRVSPDLVELQARQVVGAAVHFIDVAAAYQPPEVIRGVGRTATSGMYTLGAMLYELLANRHPHARSGDTMFEMLSRMQTSLPPPIQAFRDVPPHIAAFLDRALAGDPRRRFKRWEDFLAELPTASPTQILEAMPLPPEREPPEALEDWHHLPDQHLDPVEVPPYVPAEPPPPYHAAMDEFDYGDDGRPMLACGALLVDARPVTAAEYQRFVLAIRGRLDPEADDAPATRISQRDAARYAGWAGKRLPTEAEWTVVTRALGRRLQTGEVWEWTSTPFDQGGFVVCGGRWRNVEDSQPELANRSYELEPADDVGFRCVQDIR